MPSLERKREGLSVPTALGEDDEPYFPHTLYFNEEDIQALGLENAQIGQEMTLRATIRVTAKSAHERTGDEVDRSVTVDLIEGDVSSQRTQAEAIFGGD